MHGMGGIFNMSIFPRHEKNSPRLTKLNPMQSPSSPPTLATKLVLVIFSSLTIWVEKESLTYTFSHSRLRLA